MRIFVLATALLFTASCDLVGGDEPVDACIPGEPSTREACESEVDFTNGGRCTNDADCPEHYICIVNQGRCKYIPQ